MAARKAEAKIGKIKSAGYRQGDPHPTLPFRFFLRNRHYGPQFGTLFQLKALRAYKVGRSAKALSDARQWAYTNIHGAVAYRIAIMLRGARRRSRRAGVPFSITKSDVTIPDVCPVRGTPLQIPFSGLHNRDTPTLDRIVPELGYVPGNICVISFEANTIKKDKGSHYHWQKAAKNGRNADLHAKIAEYIERMTAKDRWRGGVT